MSFIRGTIFPSVRNQTPQPYWTLDDPYPQYVQVQRTPATINGTNIQFNVNAFDPNAFIRSKAYLKIITRIEKREVEFDNAAPPVLVADVASNYTTDDRIYKKNGMVLHNSCTNATLRLNSHTMIYKDLRYVQKKINMSFAGKAINNNFMSTSGSSYENLNGVYDEFGNINANIYDSTDQRLLLFADLGFDVVTPNQIAYTQTTQTLTLSANAGDAIQLVTTQHFREGDRIDLASGEIFRIIVTLSPTTAQAIQIGAVGDMAAQDIVVADEIRRLPQTGFNADDGRQISYDETFRDINPGQTTSTFNFTEPLAFGPFDALADYNDSDIHCKAWNLRQTKLIPYIRELQLNMDFKDIAANSLIYAYGRNNTDKAAGVNTRICSLVDVEITSAELVLIWVKPRDELLINMPRCVRIQSWQYDHKQFDLGVVNNGASVVSGENNIYTQQVPTYLLYYGMVDKDSASYLCSAVNNDADNGGRLPTLSVDINSVETGMHTLSVGEGSDFTLRSNTLGGDDILDARYNQKELYRIMLKNSVKDFPYSETKFRSVQVGGQLNATYPSQFYIWLGEQELNSFYIRKGVLQTSNVMNFNSTLVPQDGYSISKGIQAGAFNGGNKTYALHIFYIYDRYYIELCDDGKVDTKFDAQFF